MFATWNNFHSYRELERKFHPEWYHLNAEQ